MEKVIMVSMPLTEFENQKDKSYAMGKRQGVVEFIYFLENLRLGKVDLGAKPVQHLSQESLNMLENIYEALTS